MSWTPVDKRAWPVQSRRGRFRGLAVEHNRVRQEGEK